MKIKDYDHFADNMLEQCGIDKKYFEEWSMKLVGEFYQSLQNPMDGESRFIQKIEKLMI